MDIALSEIFGDGLKDISVDLPSPPPHPLPEMSIQLSLQEEHSPLKSTSQSLGHFEGELQESSTGDPLSPPPHPAPGLSIRSATCQEGTPDVVSSNDDPLQLKPLNDKFHSVSGKLPDEKNHRRESETVRTPPSHLQILVILRLLLLNQAQVLKKLPV